MLFKEGTTKEEVARVAKEILVSFFTDAKDATDLYHRIGGFKDRFNRELIQVGIINQEKRQKTRKWTRKTPCPLCGAKTGSHHKVVCPIAFRKMESRGEDLSKFLTNNK